MPTFLVTSKMNPALAARVESSLHGNRTTQTRRRRKPQWIALARLSAFALVAVCVVSVVSFWKQERDERESARWALLHAVERESSRLSEGDRKLVRRAEAALVRAAGRYAGDYIAERARGAGELDEILARPAVYVRGAIEAFGNRRALAEAANESTKDAFLLCLLDPPADREETTMLPKVLAAHAGSDELAHATPNVHRLGTAIVGLPLLAPEWIDRVRNARSSVKIERLRRQLDLAPIEGARRAAGAEILIYAFDEPKQRGAITELDGATRHAVQVGIVDVATSQTILRLRKEVDPSWVSLRRRSQHARGFNGCRLALDVRETVAPRPKTPKPSE